MSDGQNLHGRPFVGLDVFFSTDGFAERHIDDVVVLHANHDGALLFEQSLYGRYAESAGQYAVLCRGRSAAL